MYMTIEVVVVDGMVEILVTDIGQGIAESQFPYVFDQFYRRGRCLHRRQVAAA